jgi:O-antigen ligase
MKVHRFIFTAALVAFLASNFPLGRIGVFARFPSIVLLIASCVMMLSRTRMSGISTLSVTIYLFLTYSFVTTFWTENVLLSLAKWFLYATVALAFLIAGTAVTQNSSRDTNPFEPLKWLFLPMMVSSLFALSTGAGWIESNFRGYCGNSNSLGASIMLTSPWLIFELKRSWDNRRRRRWLLALAAATVVVMLATHSRAALCAFLILPAIAGKQMKAGRKVTLAYIALMALIVTYALRPESFDAAYHSYVAKRADNILASRGTQMEDSWEAAKQGGLFGEGFGVSVGLSRYWDLTTFSRISREKGNSILGIVEETGLVGLGLYIAVLCALYGALRKFSSTSDPDQKFIANIAIGYFVAALIHGQFEAWFLSFGPDVSVYWATIGMALGGLTRKTGYERNTRMETASRSRLLAPATVARS